MSSGTTFTRNKTSSTTKKILQKICLFFRELELLCSNALQRSNEDGKPVGRFLWVRPQRVHHCFLALRKLFSHQQIQIEYTQIHTEYIQNKCERGSSVVRLAHWLITLIWDSKNSSEPPWPSDSFKLHSLWYIRNHFKHIFRSFEVVFRQPTQKVKVYNQTCKGLLKTPLVRLVRTYMKKFLHLI